MRQSFLTRASSRPLLRLLACLSFFLPAEIPLLAESQPSKGVNTDSAYKLHAMDLIRLQVFQEPDLDRELRVSKDNTITAPLLGDVSVSGLTVREAEQLIAGFYGKDYLVNPQINITIVEYSSRSVNVFGSVNQPGAVAFPPEKSLTLLDAIARCGGFSRLANRTKVSLTRTGRTGQSVNYTVNADQLVGGNADNGIYLEDGDVIFVPERLL